MYRIAYRIADVSPRAAKEHPSFARLREQCPDSEDGKWVCVDHPQGGALAVWPGDVSTPAQVEDFGEPRQTTDGLTFYPSRDQPDLTDLLKSNTSRPMDGSWVTLSTGAELWIAVAVMSEVRFALCASGERRRVSMRHRYGILSREFEDLCGQKAPPDHEVLAAGVRLVVAAIHASYQITDEAIEDATALQMSHVDMMQIVHVARGLDPKGFAAVLSSSRALSSAAESQTLNSDQPSPTLLADGHLTPAALHGSA